MSDHETDTPPVGEEIHLPGPTFLPVVCAVGITMSVIGTTIGPDFIVSIIGVIIFLISVVLWVRDTRRDIAELPEEHVHH